jgi:SET domain-containing protein
MPRLTTLPAPELPTPARGSARKFVLEVRPSAIDGQGVFAVEAIPARRKIGELRGEAVSAQEAQARAKGRSRIMMIAVSERRAIDATNSADPLRFANHSCRPNATLRVQQGRVEFYAMRDVAAGEEITVNYGETHHQGRLACRCGAPGCVGRL